MNTLYSLRVEGWVKFQFKFGCVEEQLFVVVFVDSYKNGSVFYGRCLTNYCKIIYHIDITRGFRAVVEFFKKFKYKNTKTLL